MLYLRYCMTKCQYNDTFNKFQEYLKKNFPSHQLHKDKWDKNAHITYGLARYGFQEIRLRRIAWGYRFIEIRLRPQLLINPKGYYRLTSVSEFEAVRASFNYVLKDILSLTVPDFLQWNADRVEAAVDIPLPEEQLLPKYLFLFKKGNIPDYFLENEQTQKYWDSKTNVYLMTANITANWYNRYETLQIKERMSGKVFLDFSETKGILRFETQVRDGNESVIDVLDRNHLKKQVMKLYKLIVGKGDYYTLEAATRLINQSVSNQEKRCELVRMIRLIDESGSIFKAKQAYLIGKDTKAAADKFSKRINQLRKLGINPVVLPSEWDIPYLKNLYEKIEACFEM